MLSTCSFGECVVRFLLCIVGKMALTLVWMLIGDN